MRAFNQLSLSDDTKGGFPLIALYVLLDSYTNPGLGGLLEDVLGITVDNWEVDMAVVGVFESALIFVMAYFFKRYNSRKLGSTAVALLSESDKSFFSAICQRNIGSEKIPAIVLVTKDLRSLDAFCSTFEGKPCVILGGGLRLLFRREPEEALAVVAHEQAHIRTGDNTRVLFTWYLFIAYAGLACFSLLARQVWFWAQFAEMTQHYDFGPLVDTFMLNLQYAYRRGFPKFLAVPLLYLALTQLMQMREYFADERAAQDGFRAPLKDCLHAQSLQEDRGLLKNLWRFHPSLIARANRLLKQSPWRRIEMGYVTAIAFLMSRLELARPNVLGFGHGADAIKATHQGEGNLAVISALFYDSGVFFNLIASLSIVFIGSWLLSHHLYRATCSSITEEGTAESPLKQLILAVASIFVGGLFGSISSKSFTHWVSTIKSNSDLFVAETYVSEVIAQTVFCLGYLGPIILLAYFGVRKQASQTGKRLFVWTWWWFVLSSLFSMIIFSIVLLGFVICGVDWAEWVDRFRFDISFNYMLPSLVFGGLTFLVSILVWKFVHVLLRHDRGQHQGKYAQVHPSRCIDLSGSKYLGSE